MRSCGCIVKIKATAVDKKELSYYPSFHVGEYGGGAVFSKRRIRSLLYVALEQRDQWFVDVMTSDFEAQAESAFKAE
ncbi:hypothetical protein ANTQUA_LOCUS309 [Anthophora quadrimaculata]